MSARVCMCAAADVSFFSFFFLHPPFFFLFFLHCPNFKSIVSTLIFSPPALRTLAKTEETDRRVSSCRSHPPSFVSYQRHVFSLSRRKKRKKGLSAKVPQVQAPETEPRTRAMNRKKGERKTTAAVVAALGNSLILLFFPAHANTHTRRPYCECLAPPAECIRHIKPY